MIMGVIKGYTRRLDCMAHMKTAMKSGGPQLFLDLALSRVSGFGSTNVIYLSPQGSLLAGTHEFRSGSQTQSLAPPNKTMLGKWVKIISGAT